MKVQGTEKVSPLERPVMAPPKTPSQKRVALQKPVAVPPNEKPMEEFRGDRPESGTAATVTVRVIGIQHTKEPVHWLVDINVSLREHPGGLPLQVPPASMQSVGIGVGVGVTQRFPTVQTEGRQHGVVPN